MSRLHTFIATSIAAGHTVLVYKTRAVGRAARVKHVNTMDRVSVVDGVVCVDGMSTVGMTVCLKP